MCLLCDFIVGSQDDLRGVIVNLLSQQSQMCLNDGEMVRTVQEKGNNNSKMYGKTSKQLSYWN